MFNKQTFYSINKTDPNSIVYLCSDGHLLRLTYEDFSSPEEFRNWKKCSDEQYHQWENADHLYANHTISLENFSKCTASVLGPEVLAEKAEEKVVLKSKQRELLYEIQSCLTDVQFRRLWMHKVDGKTLNEIAAEEEVSIPTVYESIKAALKKVNNL